MKHIIVAREEGRFLGWPANDGVWSWADEIVVGYTNGTYEFKEQGHRISGEQPSFPALSRSRDGGEIWQREEAASYNMAAEPIPAEAIDFTHPIWRSAALPTASSSPTIAVAPGGGRTFSRISASPSSSHPAPTISSSARTSACSSCRCGPHRYVDTAAGGSVELLAEDGSPLEGYSGADGRRASEHGLYNLVDGPYSCMHMLDLQFSKQRGVIRCLN